MHNLFPVVLVLKIIVSTVTSLPDSGGESGAGLAT